MIRSMTGFAAGRGGHGVHSWAWDLRSVNGKGYDLRLRVPDWIEGLEPGLRAALGKAVARGNVTLSLRVSRAEETAALALNRPVLEAVLVAMAEIEAQAMDRGLSLAPSRASDILALRGVLEAGSGEEDTAPLAAALLAAIGPLIDEFDRMRAAEGAALAAVLDAQLDEVADLTAQAARLAEARKADMAEALRANLARVLEQADAADPQRVAQELAMLAVKADITEEIDRLGAHVAAARALIAGGGAVGRKLDFLMQEFNREANTLCAKAQSRDLTAVGLELKAVIDQMREQVQNVE